jgi:hypothetical protein
MKKQINFKKEHGFFFLIFTAAIFQSCVVYNPYSQQQVSVPDIVQMSKDGLSSKAIISDLRHTHSVYTLKADQLAKLRDEGVQDSVINYMQKTHLDAVRRDQSIADSYYSWSGGYYGPYGGFGFGWPFGYYGYGWGFGPTIVLRGGGYYGGGYRGGFHGGGGHGGMRR